MWYHGKSSNTGGRLWQKAILRKTRETRVRGGHPWLYASEIETTEGECAGGDVIDVYSCKGTFLGRALYNPRSQITLRMLTTQDEAVDEAFFPPPP